MARSVRVLSPSPIAPAVVVAPLTSFEPLRSGIHMLVSISPSG